MNAKKSGDNGRMSASNSLHAESRSTNCASSRASYLAVVLIVDEFDDCMTV
jgi:hypothetical protein